MWRLCDLHTHTGLDDSSPRMIPEHAIHAAASAGVHVFAVTDHGSIEACDATATAAVGSGIAIVAGIEVSTTSGHVLALAPGPHGLDALREFTARCGIGEGDVPFDQLVAVARSGVGPSSGRFADSIILVGAHVDQPGSLLAAGQPLPIEGQLGVAKQLDALEVMNDAIRREWIQVGVKQSGLKPPLLRSSDSHELGEPRRATWIYLPEVDFRSFRQAFHVPEASIRFEDPPNPPTHTIDSVTFVGGMHDGVVLTFDQRTNALIGSPLSGKSVVLDALRFAFGDECDIPEIAQTTDSRLTRALGVGSIVRVAGTAGGTPFQMERTWGGAQAAQPPFQPIFFSQTELVRRGMEAWPSMALLDVHCPSSGDLKRQAREMTEEAVVVFETSVAAADEAKLLRVRVQNPVDGLEATKQRLESLGGGESVARRASEVARVRAWRDRVRQEVASWDVEAPEPAEPVIPTAPTVDPQVIDLGPFLPTAEFAGALEGFNREPTTRTGGRALVRSSQPRL